jgi:hypothetical protein
MKYVFLRLAPLDYTSIKEHVAKLFALNDDSENLSP